MDDGAGNLTAEAVTMSHATDYRTLISRGRKAGLNTAEIYSALATRSSEGSDPVMGEADSNGFTRN